MGRKRIHPPNIRKSRSCGTCRHWSCGYEGEGECDRYERQPPWIGPDYDTPNPNYDEAHYYLSSTDLCNSYEARPTPPHPARRRERSRGMTSLQDALGHIERNGDLLWWPGSGYEAERLYTEMRKSGAIRTNPWSGAHELTDAGRAALASGEGK